ncbi:MAG: YebC/PmpR family DNA-binding transcriptional regulator [Armatimonadetes bacterium]|jgi:YebC/PmpR family DNA-binding regulatory protein|nr:YebC/PmpR family DNA-binding transcriptional regulator [Armatimonadota bacterium]CUU01770.1 DNA-binding regulatory protein, YebC/PmpR family [Armatimonadetes bacterium GBS]CUU36247.1 DNA-binding regulatory protein, YebC/PmpR family [Armatimonadetes bacterium GXS]CUU37884.1 DNA-binding regulatory protein, YebC/PmpR family [Armatimonadetes bacterium DC]
MAGHSKWHNIRIRKSKQDAMRSKLFTKLAREIIVAARLGGGNPDANPRLRLAIEKAREHHMPAENIKRAIQRGTGELEGVNYEEVTYEGYGPGGVAIMVECLTDNRNRTVAELRHLFSKHGGNLGESGSVAWQFKRQGVIVVPTSAIDEESLLEIALEAGAEDVQTEEEFYRVITAVEDFHRVREALQERGVPITEAQLEMSPTTTVRVEGETAEKLMRLLEALEEHDDVQNTYANFDIPDEALAGRS